MNILVTGGAGFIGSNFIVYMLRKHPSYRVVNLDKLTYAGNLANLREVKGKKNYRFVHGDICNAKLVEPLVRNAEAIVHFAAETHVDRSIISADHFIRTNVFGTYTLLEAALKYKIKRFLHVSTDEVYGSCRKGFFKENDLLAPSSPYSASKAAGDLLAHSYFVTYKLPVVITRSSNNFGPRQFPEKVIPLFVTNLLENKKVPLYAKGQNIRDWIFVEDNCRAIDIALHKGKAGEIYNIAGGNYINNISLTRRILKEMDKPFSMIQHVKDRPGHDFRYAIDCRKIKALGFRPKVSFKKGLTLTIRWYKENTAWWKPLKKKSS